MIQYLKLKPVQMLGGNLYIAKWNRGPKSALRVVPVPIVRKSTWRSNFELRMELNRPDANYVLSDDFAEVLQKDRDAKKWSDWRG